MTTQELLDYYGNLLLMQYKNLQKANSTIVASVAMVIMDQLPVQVMNAYNIDTAVGAQLDVLGKYVGSSRHGYDLSGPVSLNDNDFRLIIKMAIVQNNSGSSLADIQNLIHTYFPGVLRIFDYQTMRIDYVLDSVIGSNTVAEFFVKQHLLPKPMGVRLSALIYAPTDNNFFGFRTYEAPGYLMSGFNTYDDYQMDKPWLSYADAIF